MDAVAVTLLIEKEEKKVAALESDGHAKILRKGIHGDAVGSEVPIMLLNRTSTRDLLKQRSEEVWNVELGLNLGSLAWPNLLHKTVGHCEFNSTVAPWSVMIDISELRDEIRLSVLACKFQKKKKDQSGYSE
jgi:hypothetical protein